MDGDVNQQHLTKGGTFSTRFRHYLHNVGDPKLETIKNNELQKTSIFIFSVGKNASFTENLGPEPKSNMYIEVKFYTAALSCFPLEL
jgi:hypothetical protein